MHHHSTRLAILLGAIAATGAHAADRSWNNDYGTWNVAGNWSPVGMPGPLDSVFVGNLPIAANAFVTLSANVTVASLNVTDGMSVQTDGKQLNVTGNTLVSGENHVRDVGYSSAVVVLQGPAVNDFVTNDLTIVDGGRISLHGGATVRVNGDLYVGEESWLSGEGIVNLYGNGISSLVMNGFLSEGIDGLVLNQLGTGAIDLDGDVAGDFFNITLSNIDGSGFSSLTINGVELLDDFNDNIAVGHSNVLTMNLDEGWTMGNGSEFEFVTTSNSDGPALLNGTAFTMRGDFLFGGTATYAQINAPLILEPTASATLGPDDLFEINGPLTLNGGSYDLDEGANVVVNGAATIHGGMFDTFGATVANGSLRLNGATTWAGSLVVDGMLRQYGDAEVDVASVIDATVIDMDGDGTTSWSIDSPLTINAELIDAANNLFDGSISSTSTLQGKLTVNLDDPSAPWTMNGTMNLAGLGVLVITRVAGSPMRVTGDVDIGGRVQFTADAHFDAPSTLTFANASAELRLAGESIIDSSAAIVGDGKLTNTTTGTLTIEDAAEVANIALANDGVLELGAPTGSVTVKSLASGVGAEFVVDIAGTEPGTGYDRLQAGGGNANLAGWLSVRVIGGFEPEFGQVFSIVKAPGAVSGTFVNEPVSFVPGLAYLWSVSYSPSAVALELSGIVPCAADLSGDGMVDAADLAILLGAWGPCGGCLADINGNASVGADDLALLLGAWGPCPL